MPDRTDSIFTKPPVLLYCKIHGMLVAECEGEEKHLFGEGVELKDLSCQLNEEEEEKFEVVENFEEFEDRNCIKVVCDQQSNAVYFSREPIPTRSEISNIPMKKQICIISFKRKFLLEYTKPNVAHLTLFTIGIDLPINFSSSSST